MQTLESRVQEALDEIRVFIQADGGDIELVKIEDNKVFVKLKGACIGCPLSFITLSMGVEEAVKEKAPEITEIIRVE